MSRVCRSIRRSEDGSALLLLIGGLGVLIFGVSAVASVAFLSAQYHLQNRANDFALTAADQATGRLPGTPCESITTMASREQITVLSCHANGLEARVILRSTFGSISFTVRAHAGQQKIVPNLTSR
ncbi:MAG: hypothetical protein RLZZ600_489 [Actinomycetota bacterium]|jgi:hypothetical protein